MPTRKAIQRRRRRLHATATIVPHSQRCNAPTHSDDADWVSEPESDPGSALGLIRACEDIMLGAPTVKDARVDRPKQATDEQLATRSIALPVSPSLRLGDRQASRILEVRKLREQALEDAAKQCKATASAAASLQSSSEFNRTPERQLVDATDKTDPLHPPSGFLFAGPRGPITPLKAVDGKYSISNQPLTESVTYTSTFPPSKDFTFMASPLVEERGGRAVATTTPESPQRVSAPVFGSFVAQQPPNAQALQQQPKQQSAMSRRPKRTGLNTIPLPPAVPGATYVVPSANSSQTAETVKKFDNSATTSAAAVFASTPAQRNANDMRVFGAGAQQCSICP